MAQFKRRLLVRSEEHLFLKGLEKKRKKCGVDSSRSNGHSQDFHTFQTSEIQQKNGQIRLWWKGRGDSVSLGRLNFGTIFVFEKILFFHFDSSQF